MATNPYALNSLLSKGVAELVFDRRHLRSDSPPFRRILCTCDWNMLYSKEGREILHFTPPKSAAMSYFPPNYNLALVWDVLVQGWRCIPCESVEVRRIIKKEDWWSFYDEIISHMSAQQKIDFMKS